MPSDETSLPSEDGGPVTGPFNFTKEFFDAQEDYSKRCPVCGRTPVRENEYEALEKIRSLVSSLNALEDIIDGIKRSIVSAVTLDEAKAILCDVNLLMNYMDKKRCLPCDIAAMKGGRCDVHSKVRS